MADDVKSPFEAQLETLQSIADSAEKQAEASKEQAELAKKAAERAEEEAKSAKREPPSIFCDVSCTNYTVPLLLKMPRSTIPKILSEKYGQTVLRFLKSRLSHSAKNTQVKVQRANLHVSVRL